MIVFVLLFCTPAQLSHLGRASGRNSLQETSQSLVTMDLHQPEWLPKASVSLGAINDANGRIASAEAPVRHALGFVRHFQLISQNSQLTFHLKFDAYGMI